MSVAYVEKPDDIRCTLTFTMKLSEWKQISRTLETNNAWTELQIINEIHDLVGQLNKTYYPEVTDEN